MARRNGDYVAPWGPDGSLLHYPTDGRRFSHYEDTKTGERLEREQIWEEYQEIFTDHFGAQQTRLARRAMRGHYQLVYTEPDWRPNDPFHATLQLDSLRSGRSAKYVVWTAANSPSDTRTYPMFVTDLLDVVAAGVAPGGIVSGRWMVRKRGANYGLRLMKDGE